MGCRKETPSAPPICSTSVIDSATFPASRRCRYSGRQPRRIATSSCVRCCHAISALMLPITCSFRTVIMRSTVCAQRHLTQAGLAFRPHVLYAERMSLNDVVAGEIRSHLARRGLTGHQAAVDLGWTQPYMSRRLTGRVPFDVRDLDSLATYLDVPVSLFFEIPQGVRTPGFCRARLGLAA